MSENSFSYLLQEHMRRRKVSRGELAAATGVGPVIFKYVKGDRSVPKLEIVEKMADYLQLSINDRKELIHAWRVNTYGQARMERWDHVSEFFRHFQADPMVEPAFSFQPALEERKENISFLCSDFDVQQAILAVMEAESHQDGGGDVFAVMAADDRKLIECFYIAESHMKQLHIHHVLKLSVHSEDTARQEAGEMLSPESLKFLQQTIPLNLKSPNYESRYFYSDNARSDHWPLNASFILSEKRAVVYGEGNRGLCGIYAKDPGLVRYVRSLFDEIYHETQPFLVKSMSPEELLDRVYPNKETEEVRPVYGYDEQPCLSACLTRHMLEKYARMDEVPPELVQAYLQFIQRYKSEKKFPEMEYSYISGISRFLKTGRLDEIPESLYLPWEMKDRIAVIENWQKARKDHQTKFLRENGHRNVHLTVVIWKQTLTIDFQEKDEICKFMTQERDLIDSFTDYFDHLNPDLLLPEEEADRQIRELLDRAKKSL